jgi:tetratricopeptide (TPR) repeat protein
MTLKGVYEIGTVIVFVAVIILVTIYVYFPTNRDVSLEAETHVQRGIQLYQQGALAAAEVALKDTLKAYPDEWRVPFYLGIIKTLHKQFEQAIPHLERAYTLNPTEPKIPNALGVAYFKLGRLDLAKGYFAASLALDPANTDTKAMFDAMAKLQRRARLAENSKVDSL